MIALFALLSTFTLGQRAGSPTADPQARPSPPGAQRVQRGIAVQPETVTVGDPFRVIVRIRTAAGASLEFPNAPDSTGAVQALDPVVVTPNLDSMFTEQTAVYRMAAWDVGRQGVALPDVVVRDADGERHIALGGISVFVRSVLPADSAERVPKPPRDVLDIPLPWWWWLLAALAALAVLLLVWWLIRRRRRPAAAAPADPLELAEEAFDRVDALGLIAAGERARHVALVIEVLRDYLARVAPPAATALTTSEVLAALRGEKGVPVNRLAALLTEVDLVKFARRPVASERAQEIGREARTIVRGVHESRYGVSLEKAA